MIKKASFIAIIALFFVALPAFARSGCCSYHGGVKADETGCNDGTPFSATCAPYYQHTAPQTQSQPVVAEATPTPYIPLPTSTPKPVYKKVIKPTPTKKPKPTKKPVKKIKKITKTYKHS